MGGSQYYPNYGYSPSFSFGNPVPGYGNRTYVPDLYPAGGYAMGNSEYYPGYGYSPSQPYGGPYSQPYYNQPNYGYFPEYYRYSSMQPSYNQPYNYSSAYYQPQPYSYGWNPLAYGGYNTYNYPFNYSGYANYNYNGNQESDIERHEIAQMGSFMRLCIGVPGLGGCFTADENYLEEIQDSKIYLVPDNEMSQIASILSDLKIYKWEPMTASSPYSNQDVVLLVYGDDPAGSNNFQCTIGKDYEAVIHLESLLPALSGEAQLCIKQIIDFLKF